MTHIVSGTKEPVHTGLPVESRRGESMTQRPLFLQFVI